MSCGPNLFHCLFIEGRESMVPNPEYVERRVTETHNFSLLQPFTYAEFTITIHQLHPHKSSGPDDFNPAFYQKFWPLIGKEVFQECSAWLKTNAFPPSVNDTIITQTPKLDSPTLMKDFRRISLCNVLYCGQSTHQPTESYPPCHN